MRFGKRVDMMLGGGVGYVDLGRKEMIGGKGEGGEKVMRVKGRREGFGGERKLWVMWEEGSLFWLKGK